PRPSSLYRVRSIPSTRTPVVLSLISSESSALHRSLHSFPTRRSSDLVTDLFLKRLVLLFPFNCLQVRAWAAAKGSLAAQARTWRDRKSTRLNSSHQIISYAVFCLKKKKTPHSRRREPKWSPSMTGACS